MQTNGQCSEPCFWGISPGLTHYDQAVQFLKSLGNNLDEKIVGDEKHYYPTFEYKGTDTRIGIAVSALGNNITSLNAYAYGLQAPNITGKDWLAFRPDSILKAYGQPQRVLIVMGQGPEGRVFYSMIFIFDQIYLEYFGNQFITLPQKILHACPILDQNVANFNLWLGSYDEKKMVNGNRVHITLVTSLTMDRFYQIIVGDPDLACFNLDYQKYMDQSKK